MKPLSRPARLLVSIAVVSLAAMVLLYAFPASDRRTLIIITDLSWSWAAGFDTITRMAFPEEAFDPPEVPVAGLAAVLAGTGLALSVVALATSLAGSSQPATTEDSAAATRMVRRTVMVHLS